MKDPSLDPYSDVLTIRMHHITEYVVRALRMFLTSQFGTPDIPSAPPLVQNDIKRALGCACMRLYIYDKFQWLI